MAINSFISILEFHNSIPPNLELQRTRVSYASDAPMHTGNILYSGAYTEMGVDNSLCFDEFLKNFRVNVISLEEDEMEFDMIGIDASIANAFRRILIVELPTMVIEKVLIANNTSVVQDEVLSHRLGLFPFNVDPRLFEYMSKTDTPNEKNTIFFKLNAQCGRKGNCLTVKYNELKWLPNGSELEMGIELEAHAVKGLGKSHAKWSPVCTTWYRMPAEVMLLQEVKDEKAEELVKKFLVNVFDIEDIDKGRKREAVARLRLCTLCRECIRGDNKEKCVALRHVKDHFIFKIESARALPPEVLFTKVIKILEEKCERVITELT
ncbi:hypothetical protein GIB67_022842 [Kingdonia uniflora]|uniref:DNA-directed RNA polymerase RpoA/D/Rpb3-type domain-containing protein n=1 Tax=Kingdonia uniflora TaxID=39325 RepID=A0A7J7P6V4_9MAGN|nr:hypothetical protein GIB67_022842 [Kingdonia uniflora]